MDLRLKHGEEKIEKDEATYKENELRLEARIQAYDRMIAT
jgi:hypothetical protein